MNCWVEPVIKVELLGDTAIELMTLVLTVRVVVCFWPPSAAVIVVEPRATAVAKPDEVIVAIAGFDEVQVTVEVTSRVLPSPKTPLAENCWVPVGVIDGFVGLMVNDARSLGPMKKLSQAVRVSSSAIANSLQYRLHEFVAINRYVPYETRYLR